MKTLIKVANLLIMFLPGLLYSQGINKNENAGKFVKAQEQILDQSSGSLSLLQGNKGGGGYFSAGFSGQMGMYLNDDWVPGYIVLNDGTSFDKLLLRYDIYHQQMQFIKDNDTLAVKQPCEIKYILLGDRKFIQTEFNNEGAIQNGYFEMLTDGDCKLLFRRLVKYHFTSDTGNENPRKDYAGEGQYFICKKGDHVARQILPARKSILSAFSDEEKNMKEFIKVNNLKIRTKADLKLVVEFYNSLK